MNHRQTAIARIAPTFISALLTTLVFCTGCASDNQGGPSQTTGVEPIPQNPHAIFTTVEDVTFEEVMPGLLWMGRLEGDPTHGAHASLVRVAAGGSIGSHSYSAAIDGYVLQGVLEQPTPSNQANVTPLRAGAFFHLPAAAEHASRCASEQDCLFYIHQDGAFDFVPRTAPASDSNVAQNPDAVFVTNDAQSFDPVVPGVVSMRTVFGNREEGAHGTVVEVAAGATLPPHYYSREIRGVVLEGTLQQPAPSNQSAPVSLPPAAFFYLPATAEHGTSCATKSSCVFFVQQSGPFDMVMIE